MLSAGGGVPSHLTESNHWPQFELLHLIRWCGRTVLKGQQTWSQRYCCIIDFLYYAIYRALLCQYNFTRRRWHVNSETGSGLSMLFCIYISFFNATSKSSSSSPTFQFSIALPVCFLITISRGKMWNAEDTIKIWREIIIITFRMILKIRMEIIKCLRI